jgi:hypothetical protein
MAFTIAVPTVIPAQPSITPEFDAALRRWTAAQEALYKATGEELAAREAVVAAGFKAPVEGVNNVPIGNGWTLEGTFRNNYNLDNAEVETALKQLPTAIARELVSWSAKLKVGQYKKLEPAHKAIVNEVLTIKPGLPALKLIPPKEGT